MSGITLRRGGIAMALAGGAMTGAIACGSSSASKGTGAVVDGSVVGDAAHADGASSNDGTSSDASGSDAGEIEDAASAQDAALGPHATVRVADFSLPHIDFDFCFSTDAVGASAAWTGPMLPSETFLMYETPSPYVYAPVGTRSIRFVPRDSGSCIVTFEGVPDFSLPTPLADGSRSTLLFSGTGFDGGSFPYQLFQLTDESIPDDGGNKFRIVNLDQVHPAIDIYAHKGQGDAASCDLLLYSNITYGNYGVTPSLPGDGGPTDENGYTPVVGETLTKYFFDTIDFSVHGQACSQSFEGYYGTSGTIDFGHGAWTMFIPVVHVPSEGGSVIVCRDDGNDENAYCSSLY